MNVSAKCAHTLMRERAPSCLFNTPCRCERRATVLGPGYQMLLRNGWMCARLALLLAPPAHRQACARRGRWPMLHPPVQGQRRALAAMRHGAARSATVEVARVVGVEVATASSLLRSPHLLPPSFPLRTAAIDPRCVAQHTVDATVFRYSPALLCQRRPVRVALLPTAYAGGGLTALGPPHLPLRCGALPLRPLEVRKVVAGSGPLGLGLPLD